MKRKAFLTLVAIVPMAIGALALLAPSFLITELKGAESNAAAEVMARTVGVLLLSFGVLNFLIRGMPDSPTLRAVLIANLVLQLAIAPIDPMAYASGAFVGLGSFLPNSVLHLALAGGFAYYLSALPASVPSGGMGHPETAGRSRAG